LSSARRAFCNGGGAPEPRVWRRRRETIFFCGGGVPLCEPVTISLHASVMN